MNPRYVYSLRERAALAVLNADDAGRRELLDAFRMLTQSPNRSGAEQVIDETGRINEVT